MRVPIQSLKGVKRIKLGPGESTDVEFKINQNQLELADEEGEKQLEAGEFKITVAGSAPGKRSRELGTSEPVETILRVEE